MRPAVPEEVDGVSQMSGRPNGGAARHPWYDDRLGRTLRAGLGEVRAAEPSADGWRRLATELGLPLDAGAPLGLPTARGRWALALDRLRRALSQPLGRVASIGAIAMAVLVVGISVDVVLSGHTDGPFAWTAAGLHEIGVPLDEAGIQPSPQNRAPSDMSAARWRPRAARGAAPAAGSPLVLAPLYASRFPARVVVPR